MGLIRAIASAASSTLGDEFKEYVTCPQVSSNVLIARGNVEHGKGNKNASEGIISNGSKIVIPKGWAMMLVDNGKVEFSSEEGEYIYDNSTEPSIFSGGLGKGIIDTFKKIGERFTYGGQTAHDQRVYYINLLEVTGNKFGSSSPKDIYDETYQMSIKMTFYGNFAYRVDDPITLVGTVIGGNPKDNVTFDEVFGDQFRSDINEQMHKALTNIMAEKKIRYSQIGAYGSDISDEMNSILSEKWTSKYGVIITKVSMENIGTTDEYTKIIKDIEAKNTEARMLGATYSNNMSGTMAAATAEAMKNASSNDNGAMMGFAGLNMAQNAGSNIMNTVAEMDTKPSQEDMPVEKETKEEPSSSGLNFCPNCGEKTTGGNFCGNCGNKLK